MTLHEVNSIELMDDNTTLSFVQIASCIDVDRDRILELVEAGLVEPIQPSDANTDAWLFPARALSQLRTALRLVNDLGVNAAGAAVIMQLIAERNALLSRLSTLERF